MQPSSQVSTQFSPQQVPWTLQPRNAFSVSSRTSLRKGLGLERLAAKLNKPQALPTIELWVQYQQQKLTSALSQAKAPSSTASSICSFQSDATAQQLADSLPQPQQPVKSASSTSSAQSRHQLQKARSGFGLNSTRAAVTPADVEVCTTFTPAMQQARTHLTLNKCLGHGVSCSLCRVQFAICWHIALHGEAGL